MRLSQRDPNTYEEFGKTAMRRSFFVAIMLQCKSPFLAQRAHVRECLMNVRH